MQFAAPHQKGCYYMSRRHKKHSHKNNEQSTKVISLQDRKQEQADAAGEDASAQEDLQSQKAAKETEAVLEGAEQTAETVSEEAKPEETAEATADQQASSEEEELQLQDAEKETEPVPEGGLAAEMPAEETAVPTDSEAVISQETEVSPKAEASQEAEVSQGTEVSQETAVSPENIPADQASSEEELQEAEDELQEDWRDTLAYLEQEESKAAQEAKAQAEKAAEEERKKQEAREQKEALKTSQREAKKNKKAARKAKKQTEKKKPLPWKQLLTAALALVLICMGIYTYKRFAPSTTHMDTKEYYEWMVAREQGAEEVSLDEDELAVVLQDHVAVRTALLRDEHIYLDYETVRENIFTRFYWDEPNEVMLYTTQDDTWQIPLDSAEYTTKDGTETYEVPVFITNDSRKYICADFLSQYVNLEVINEADTSHVVVNYIFGDRAAATVEKKTAIRFGGNIKQDIVATADKGETVYVLKTQEDWTRILTQNGFIGWVQTKRLSDVSTVTTEHDFEEPVYTSIHRDELINLVWHQISNDDANKYFTSDTAGISGVNVISPTWISLTDNEGNFSSYANASYVTKAHKKDMEVWALVDNFSANMSTTTLLASTTARNQLVSNLITEALEVGLDGINIDFETLAEEAGYSYVQFIRELSVACRENGLVLSVDIPVTTAYNDYFDREELGVFCDYVIMMGYDEHYSGSEAGSVASLSFEEEGIQAALEEIPAEKLISAVPFYTRLWYTLTTDSETTTWSEAYGMDTIATTLDTYDVDTTWDDETQQNYAEWTLDDGTLCQIWVEDEESLAKKAALVSTYSLGGIAEWALGYERSSVWSVIAENIGA